MVDTSKYKHYTVLIDVVSLSSWYSSTYKFVLF